MVVLLNTDRKKQADDLEKMLFQEIERALPGQNIAETLTSARTNPSDLESILRQSGLSQDRFNHYHTIQNTLRTYTPILASREQEAAQNDSFKAMEEAIYALKTAGYTPQQAVKFLSEIKIAKAGTSHPTEGLNKEGIALCRELVASAEQENPKKAIQTIINKMIKAENIGATAKDGILDEIDSTNIDSRIHNDGAYILNSFAQDTLKKVYEPAGKDLQAVNDLAMDICRRSWDYDSDGKNNAEGWAMITKLSTSTSAAILDVEQTLLHIQQAIPSLFDEESKALLTNIQNVQKRLAPVYERSREITKKLAEMKTPAKREQFYKDHYEEYQNIQKQFAAIYNDVDPAKRGEGFYHQTVAHMASLRDTLYQNGYKQDGDFVDRNHYVLRRNGFVLEKAQPRQNDLVHGRIIDNLFAHDGFRARGVISGDEAKEIDTAGGFNKLPLERQHELREKAVKYVKHNGNRKDVLQDLFDANPLAFNSGNGFPDQERTLLDRFSSQQVFSRKFAENIISDCQEYGPERQKFLASLFGIKDMQHMALHEDRLNLTRQGELLKGIYSRAAEPQRIKIKELTKVNEQLAALLGSRGIHETHIMRPCSDAERGGGSGTRQEAIDVYRQLVRISLELANETKEAVPIEIMLGCGASMQRYGGDPEIIRSVIEQELKAHAIKRRDEGLPLDPHNDKNDRRMLRSCLAILWTEQGRAKRMMTATPGQIADDFSKYITRMIKGRLDIEDALEQDYTFIQKPSATEAQRLQRAKYYNTQIDRYEIMRNVHTDKDPSSIKVLDALSLKATCPIMCKYMNNASRPASKKVGIDLRTEKRAIENNERDYASGLFLGRYGGGAMMAEIHKDYLSGALTKDDLQALLDDPEWEYNLFTKDLADAQRADYAYALKQLGWANATFDELMEAGRTATSVNAKGQGHSYFVHDKKYTQEQAYLAKAYYDHTIYLAQTEAALNGHFDQSLDEMVTAIKAKDGSIHPKMGAASRKKFPIAVEIAQESDLGKASLQLLRATEEKLKTHMDSGMTEEEAVNAEGGEAHMRQICASWRSTTSPHWKFWSGQVNMLAHTPDPKQTLATFIQSKPSSSDQIAEPNPI